jgi:hypothetical protein
MSSDHSRTALIQIYVSAEELSVGASSPWSWPVCEVPAISAERQYWFKTVADDDEMYGRRLLCAAKDETSVEFMRPLLNSGAECSVVISC